eukprot:125259-Prymnesium_polylepis.2
MCDHGRGPPQHPTVCSPCVCASSPPPKRPARAHTSGAQCRGTRAEQPQPHTSPRSPCAAKALLPIARAGPPLHAATARAPRTQLTDAPPRHLLRAPPHTWPWPTSYLHRTSWPPPRMRRTLSVPPRAHKRSAYRAGHDGPSAYGLQRQHTIASSHPTTCRRPPVTRPLQMACACRCAPSPRSNVSSSG